MITAKYHQSKNQIAEEESLIRKAQEDSAAFEPLYTAYYKRILEFSYKRLNTVDDARDVTQQVFLNALTNLKNYECRGLPFSSWLFRIALNEMNSHFRKTKKFRAVNLDTVSLGHLVSEMWPVREELPVDQLAQSLTKISSLDYLLIEMRFFEQRAFKEIAEILEITENNAKVKTYRALDRLKVAFNTTNH
jgi:RNA polymerase sigma-70 factor, ECF subfamily